MNCPDCTIIDGKHQPQCPCQPYPSELIENQILSDPRERYQKRREMERFIQGEKK